MPLLTQPYKGARDFYPEDKRLQKYLFNVMRSVVEKFGYEEYDAPILEPIELYSAKTSEEIVNEQTYSFEDRGGRKVVLRPEMTPTVSRLVAAKRQELAYPLRWYSIPNLWRYERPQRGRLREHWQLNVDLFGVDGLEAEHEVILVADSVLRAYGAKRENYVIKVNSRKLINSFLKDVLGLDDTQSTTLIRLIDKKNKLDNSEFVGQAEAIFTPSQREAGLSDRLFEFLHATSLDKLSTDLAQHESCTQLTKLINMLNTSSITNVVFDPSLMRGFDYYTDIVFEMFDTNPDNNRSMFGGGRYDGLVAKFGVEPVSTVGFGMGDVTLQNFLEAHSLLPQLTPETDIYVVLIGDVYEKTLHLLSKLQQLGVRVAVDTTGRKADKQIRSAEKKGINYVLFIGDKELADEQFTLKNLKTGEEARHGLDRLVSIIKDYRKK